MYLKKSLFYLISLFLFLIILETISIGLIHLINKHPLIIKSKNFYKSKSLIKDFSQYLNFIPYIDDSIKFRDYIDKSSSKDLFFNTFETFSDKNVENILIQGDSWAASANEIAIKENLKKKIKTKNFGLINAGKTSYSISPMTVQLDILLEKFNLKPSIIIAIIDQTDIGDELHRYQSLDVNSLDLTDSNISSEFKYNFFQILDSKKFNLIKMVLLTKEFWLSRYNQFDRNFFKTIKYCTARLFYLMSNTPTVLAPLKYGISNEEKNLIEKRFNIYINKVFENHTKKLIFVSHPHKNHILNEYKINISNIIDSLIEKSEYKKDILHINFSKNFSKVYNEKKIDQIFITSDPTSHLFTEIYMKIYFPYIFNKCCEK